MHVQSSLCSSMIWDNSIWPLFGCLLGHGFYVIDLFQGEHEESGGADRGGNWRPPKCKLIPSKKRLATSNLQFLYRTTQKSPLPHLYFGGCQNCMLEAEIVLRVHDRKGGTPQKGWYFGVPPYLQSISSSMSSLSVFGHPFHESHDPLPQGIWAMRLQRKRHLGPDPHLGVLEISARKVRVDALA